MKKMGNRISKTERIKTPILGIFVDSTSKGRALNRAWEMGCGGDKEDGGKRPKLIVTPNPEIILAGARDKNLGAILNKAGLALPDGVGVVLAMRFLKMREMGVMEGGKEGILRPLFLALQGLWVSLSLFINRRWLFALSEVVPGRWLFEELVRKAAKEERRVFLLGGKTGVAEAAALNIKYPRPRQAKPQRQNRFGAKRGGQISNIKYDSGPWLNIEGKPRDEKQKQIQKKVIEEINTFKPNFLFVGFGHPKQEKWLSRNLSKLNVGVAMTVGGAFDYLAGSVPKPPKWMAAIGFEWLWRLVTQPRRIGRVFTAIIVFPLKLYLNSLK